MGFSVVAADIDTSGLTDLESDSQVEIITADLERAPWPLEDRTFGGVVVTNYLHRPHFPLLTSALANRGVMIFETFGQGNEHLGRPRNPDFLLKPGELLEAFGRDLQVVAYEHGEERDPRPAVRQRICVVNGPGPNALLHK